MIIYGGFLPIGKRIGFGGTQYTLWNIGPEIDGKQECSYYQNIGTDLAEVKAKYPNLPITDLKGNVWQYREPKVEHEQNTDYFKFGRYSDQKFTEVNDSSYMEWYAFEDRYNETLHSHMVSLGYTKVNDSWYTAEELEIEKKKAQIELDKNNRTVEGMFQSNFNVDDKSIAFITQDEEEDGDYAPRYDISDDLKKELEYASYNGWDWGYLPELAKRRSMKGQMFTVTFEDGRITKVA